MKRLLLLPALVVLPVLAEPSVSPLSTEKDSNWRGEGALGFNRSTGNNNTTNLLGKVKLLKKVGYWDYKMKLEAYLNSNDVKKTRETYIVDLQASYNSTDARYSFTNLRYTDDRFGAFNSQTSLSAGMGWHAIRNKRSSLDLEGGFGYRYSEANKSGNIFSEAVFRGKGKWEYRLSDTTKLTESVRVESGPDNTVYVSEAAMRVRVSKNFGLKLNYRVKTNTTVPEGRENTDTLTAVSFDYLF